MAFLLIVSITSLLAMLPYRKGSCSDFRITGSFRGNRTAPDLFEFIVFCLELIRTRERFGFIHPEIKVI